MGTAIALGNFDGVHIAHAALVQLATAYADEHNIISGAYVFEPHPRVLLCPETDVKLLMTAKMKARRLCEAGAWRVYFEKRGMEILSLSPKDFVKKILCEELDAQFVVAGFNYRFGAGASGDAKMLMALCRASGIDCRIMEPMEKGGTPVSSTRLRALLASGDIKEYNALSFKPYTVSGTVIKGKQLGRTLGFPTMNTEIPNMLLLPKKGVYISRTFVDGKWYGSVTNIGQNPTVESALPRAESYLLGFSGEVYGKETDTELLEFIRPEQKFPDVRALCAQIQKDTETAKAYFEDFE